MKTAMQELIEKLESTKLNSCKHLYEVVFFDGILAIIEGGEYIEKEKQQIIDARMDGVNCALSFGKAHLKPSEDYYNGTYIDKN